MVTLLTVLLTPKLAQNGVATQKTTFKKGTRTPDVASFAIDGDFTTDLKHLGRCAKTNDTAGQWWQVDLRAIYEIHKVAITSRNIHGELFCFLG